MPILLITAGCAAIAARHFWRAEYPIAAFFCVCFAGMLLFGEWALTSNYFPLVD